MTTRQLSRVSGVPRFKLPIWKAAAAQFWAGKEPSRTDQQNKGHRTKVALLRELAATDPAVKSWVIKFATEQRGKDARQLAAEQGLAMPDVLGEPSVSDVDRLVRMLEAGKELTAEDLEIPGDPAEQARLDAAAVSGEPKPVTHGCNTCGFNNGPATRDITVNGKVCHFCDRHDGTRPYQAQPVPEYSPAAYVNSSFGTAPSPTDSPRVQALKAIRAAQEDSRGGTPVFSHYPLTEPLK